MSVRQFRCALVAMTLLTGLVAPLLAAPADTVRIRVAGFRDLGAAFKAVNDGLRGDIQIIEIRQQARMIANVARDQYNWFPAGTGPQPGIKTNAKPAIWAQAATFRAAQDAFARQAQAFQRTASGNDGAAIRAEARKLGATCKACHDTFRVPQT